MPQIPTIYYLVLSVIEGGGKSLSFVVDEDSEFLLKLLDFELKVPAHLLYKQISWICISSYHHTHSMQNKYKYADN